jgi:hypothetical protein
MLRRPPLAGRHDHFSRAVIEQGGVRLRQPMESTMFLRTNLALLAALAFAPGAPILSGETFFRVPLKELQLAGGALPNAPAARFFGRSDRDFSKLSNRVTLEGGGEGFLRFSSGGEPPDAAGGGEPGSEVLVLRLPEAGDAKGKIHVPAEDGTGLVAFAFTIPAAEANPAARVDFYRAKSEAFSELARLSIPGAAWFRHQADAAARALERPGEAASSARPGATGAGGRRPERPTGLEDTYEIFSGGRALSENLQLDRVLAPLGVRGPDGRRQHARRHHGGRDRLEAARQGSETGAGSARFVDSFGSARAILPVLPGHGRAA